MRFDILTIFPHCLDSYVNESLIKKAREAGVLDIRFYDIREFSRDKHKKVDDAPYGGGPGMIFKVKPIWRCLRSVVGSGGIDIQVQKNQKSPPKADQPLAEKIKNQNENENAKLKII